VLTEDQAFIVELADEGTLFRAVERAPEREVPAWTKRRKK
jgi:hypothetical protein